MSNDIKNDINELNESENNPPFFDTWNKLYSVVFISLVIMVMLFYLFTKAFE